MLLAEYALLKFLDLNIDGQTEHVNEEITSAVLQLKNENVEKEFIQSPVNMQRTP